MSTSTCRVLFVQFLTSVRVIAALSFAAIAVFPQYALASLVCYLAGLLSDAIDGFAARYLHVTTRGGAAYDGFADKAMTVVSALYCVAIEAPLIPCALVVLRDVLVLSLRAIAGEKILLSPSRLNGMITGASLKLITTSILVTRYLKLPWHVPPSLYWIAAAVSVGSLSRELWINRVSLSEVFKPSTQ